MRFKKQILLAILFLFLVPFTTFGAATYVKDEAGVLNASTIQTINTNFAKVEANTKAQVKIVTVKSLQGKDINEYAASVAKTATSTDKYAIFVVATEDHKNKFLVGAGLNGVFTSSEIDRISALPNSYFKTKDFNTGILKVGKAIDEGITTKAVKSGKVEVVDNGLSKTVQAKKSYTGLIIFLILLAVAIIAAVYYFKKKAQADVNRFARENGLENDPEQGSKGFRSGNLTEETPNYNNTNPNQGRTNGGNNTTVINQNGGYGNGGNGFVEGMIVGNMLNNNHHHDYHEPSRSNHENNTGNSSWNNEEETKVSSGSWDSSDGNSDWGGSSSDSSSDSSSSDSSSGSSDW